MINPNQGEIWVDNAEIFAVSKVKIYLTNQFASGTCEADKIFGHEMMHWWGGCSIFERMLPFLQRELDALPGPTTKQLVNGNAVAVQQARRDLDARFRRILRCFRVEACRGIESFNHRLDGHDYPVVFDSCPKPHPPVPSVPPLTNYLNSCPTPPVGCPQFSGIVPAGGP